MTRITVFNGDIATVQAHTLIATINSTGYWDGAIDNVIGRCAGSMFHDQARAAMPLKDGQYVYARQTRPHDGSFENVLFAVDDLKLKAYSVVTNALRAAAYNEISSVSLAPIRTGNHADAFEPRAQALTEVALAVQDFVDDDTLSIDEITLVSYYNPKDYAFLLQQFQPA